MYVIGIDGGGTKTTAVMADAHGSIVAQATVGATNPNSVELQTVQEELKRLFNLLKEKSPDTFHQVVGVYAGMGNETVKKQVEQFLVTLVGQSIRVTVDNDAVIALYSGTLGAAGIVQISGTGSITYGLGINNQRARVGGWGYLIGDEGSGYAIGRDGLQAVLQAHDGLGETTSLSQLIMQHFQVTSPPELIPYIYGEKPRETIATISKLVVEAADHQDEIALRILHRQGKLMGASIACLLEKLYGAGSEGPVPVVLTGGVMSRADLFQQQIQEVLNDKGHTSFTIQTPKLPPIGGAVVAALFEQKVAVERRIFEANFLET